MWLLIASAALRLAPPASTLMASPTLWPAQLTMGTTSDGPMRYPDACTMNGGRPGGTVIRQSNGLIVVPATDDVSSPATGATESDRVTRYRDACTMNGGRPGGSVVLPPGSAASLSVRSGTGMPEEA